MKYLLIIHNNPALLGSLPKEELDAMMNAHEPFQQALKESGELVGFVALADAADSRVIRVLDQVPAVTDGPFVEAKEYLAGFYVVDCDSFDRAVELAGRMPEARYQGVEVRPVLAESGLGA
ncbi:YciI family protein [Microbispora sp. NPDC049125]|uniref:YciI family protein n=1 Tax=Microbispora sp. NPDC049125 TaxID=3154929 RepID=UPI003466943F